MRKAIRVGSVVSILFTGLALAMASGCAAEAEEEGIDGEDAVSARNQTATSFGLTDKEIVLTLDDGPGPRTVELARWLAQENVPTTFFMVGKNAKANPSAVQEVARLSNEKNGLFIVANHSFTHTTPLPKQGVAGATSEIMDADAVLSANITESQKKLPSATSFFRPPYGAFTALGQGNIDRINANGAAKYVGPVFWDIGGELTDTYSADWACWGKVTIDRCIDGYIAETQKKGRGIVLAHDVHSKTVDMLTGANGGRSLIKDLRAKGYKFVSLRAHEQAVQQYNREETAISTTAEIVIDAAVTTAAEGRVVVNVRTQGAAKVSVAFDDKAPTATFPAEKQVDATLPPGQHYVTVSAFDAAGTIKKQQRYTFVIAGQIMPNTPETTNTTNAVCVNFDLMKTGQLFRFYNKKVSCDAPPRADGKPGAYHVPNSTDCYAYKGTLKAVRDPKLVGAGEWTLDFDLTYKADPNDKSKIGVTVNAATGFVEAGRRYWPGTTKKDVALVVEDRDVKCDQGRWPGKLVYSNGASEDALLQTVKNPATGASLDNE